MPGFSRRLRASFKRMADAIVGAVAVGTLKFIRLIPPDVISGLGGWLMRRIGPLIREHRTGRANLKAAFPEKSDAEIEQILRGVWDNLGRTGAEFVHTDRLWDYDPTDLARSRVMDITVPLGNLQRAVAPGKGVLFFSAHLGNWELPAVACHALGFKETVLYRRPNLSAVAKAVTDIRANCMGTMIPAGPAAPIQLAEAVERGEIVGLLVDQYYVRGVPVTFFGRRTRANPMIARLARHFDCAIHGTRAVRHPGNRFEFTVTEAITPVRDAEGKIEVEGTMQAITNVIEGWVREHPEQWLWLHRRWRDE